LLDQQYTDPDTTDPKIFCRTATSHTAIERAVADNMPKDMTMITYRQR